MGFDLCGMTGASAAMPLSLRPLRLLGEESTEAGEAMLQDR